MSVRVLGVQADALARAEELEEENARLRQAAGRRRAVLAQSRQFLAAYAQRAAAMLKEQQAAGADPVPASGANPALSPVGSAAVSAAITPGLASSNGASASARGELVFSEEAGMDGQAGPGTAQVERAGVAPSAVDGQDPEGGTLQE